MLFFFLFFFSYSIFSFDEKYENHYLNLLNQNIHLAAKDKSLLSLSDTISFYQANLPDIQYQKIAKDIFDKDKLSIQKHLPVFCALSGVAFFVPCHFVLQKILQDLAPRCNKISIPDFVAGVVDLNSCYAGGKLAIESFPKNPWGRNSDIDIFLTNLWNKVLDNSLNSEIDLYSTYKKSQKESTPKEFLAVMTFLLTAKNIGGGALDDFTSYNFSKLMQQREGASFIIAELLEMKEIKNSYVAIQKVADQKNIQFKIRDQVIKIGDRHRLMGIFLACHFKGKLGTTVPTEIFPILLGIAYESMDFVSHLKEGISLKKSTQNFLQDVNKYKEAVFFAQKFCL